MSSVKSCRIRRKLHPSLLLRGGPAVHWEAVSLFIKLARLIHYMFLSKIHPLCLHLWLSLTQTLLQKMLKMSIPTPAVQNRDIPFCLAKRGKWVTNKQKLWVKDAGCCTGAWDAPQRSSRNVRRFQRIVGFYQMLAQKLSRKRKIGR